MITFRVFRLSFSHNLCRFHVATASWLCDSVRAAVQAQLGPQLTRDGWLVVKSDRTNSLTLNTADALEKLRANIRWAVEPGQEESSDALVAETQRKSRLRAARERLHIPVDTS